MVANSVTWNMQGGNDSLDNKWNKFVKQLVREKTYVCLQEAGKLPASNVSDEDPPPGDDSIDENYQWRYVKWNIGTRDRPEDVYVFWMLRSASQVRVSLAICSKAKADRLLFINPVIANGRPSIGIELGPDRVYTLHALSSGGGDAPGLVRAIAGGPQPWYALGDYNREPNSWEGKLPEGSIIDPPDKATQQSGKKLDYMISFAPGGVEPTTGKVGDFWSDHAPVFYD